MLPSYKLSTVWNKEDKYTPLIIPSDRCQGLLENMEWKSNQNKVWI